MGSSAAVRKNHRVLLADKEISLAGIGFKMIREKANKAGLDSAHKRWLDLGLRPPMTINRRQALRRIARPLFDASYNFARWLVAPSLVDPSNDAEGLSYKRSISRLYAISNRYAAWTLANSHSFGTD